MTKKLWYHHEVIIEQFPTVYEAAYPSISYCISFLYFCEFFWVWSVTHQDNLCNGDQNNFIQYAWAFTGVLFDQGCNVLVTIKNYWLLVLLLFVYRILSLIKLGVLTSVLVSVATFFFFFFNLITFYIPRSPLICFGFLLLNPYVTWLLPHHHWGISQTSWRWDNIAICLSSLLSGFP